MLAMLRSVCGWKCFGEEIDSTLPVALLILSRSSNIKRSAVFLPTPGIVVRATAFPHFNVILTLHVYPDKYLRNFGPTPETEIRSLNSRLSSQKKSKKLQSIFTDAEDR